MPNKNLPPVTRDNIRRLRILKGLKQFEAGKKLGMGQQAYSKIECQPVVSEVRVRKIIKAFESSRKELEFIIKATPPNIR